MPELVHNTSYACMKSFCGYFEGLLVANHLTVNIEIFAPLLSKISNSKHSIPFPDISLWTHKQYCSFTTIQVKKPGAYVVHLCNTTSDVHLFPFHLHLPLRQNECLPRVVCTCLTLYVLALH